MPLIASIFQTMRDRASVAKGGRIEGRRSHADMDREMVAHAKRLARKNPKTGKARSLREIAAELEKLGHVNQNGKQFAAKSVASMLGGCPMTLLFAVLGIAGGGLCLIRWANRL